MCCKGKTKSSSTIVCIVYVTVVLYTYRESYKTFMFFSCACANDTKLISFPRIHFCWYSAFYRAQQQLQQWKHQAMSDLYTFNSHRKSERIQTVTMTTTSLCSFPLLMPVCIDVCLSHLNKHYITMLLFTMLLSR